MALLHYQHTTFILYHVHIYTSKHTFAMTIL